MISFLYQKMFFFLFFALFLSCSNNARIFQKTPGSPFDIQVNYSGEMIYVAAYPDDPNPRMDFDNGRTRTFLATGYGALGTDLNTHDQLISYHFIPVQVNVKTILTSRPQVSIGVEQIDRPIEVSNDQCQPLFVYDAQAKGIRLQRTYRIDDITECQITITVTASLGKNLHQDEKIITVILGPTLERYAWLASFAEDATDPWATHGYQYLRYLSGNTPGDPFAEAKTVARWIKEGNSGRAVSSFLFIKGPDAQTPPLKDVNVLASVAGVVALDLSQTTVSSLKALRFTPNLERLNISTTPIDTGEIRILYDVRTLRSLSMKAIGLKNFTYVVEGLTFLEELDVSQNPLTELGGIGRLQNLRIFNAVDIKLTSFPPTLFDLEKLEILNLSHNRLPSLDEESALALANLPSLTSLDISMTNLAPSWMESFFAAQMQKGCGLPPEEIAQNTACLKDFTARNNGRPYISDESNVGYYSCTNSGILAQDFARVPSFSLIKTFEKVDIYGNLCHDGKGLVGFATLEAFAQMPNLQRLDIGNHLVKDVYAMRDNTTLTYLNLAGTGVQTRSTCERQLAGAINPALFQACAELPQ